MVLIITSKPSCSINLSVLLLVSFMNIYKTILHAFVISVTVFSCVSIAFVIVLIYVAYCIGDAFTIALICSAAKLQVCSQ